METNISLVILICGASKMMTHLSFAKCVTSFQLKRKSFSVDACIIQEEVSDIITAM